MPKVVLEGSPNSTPWSGLNTTLGCAEDPANILSSFVLFLQPAYEEKCCRCCLLLLSPSNAWDGLPKKSCTLCGPKPDDDNNDGDYDDTTGGDSAAPSAWRLSLRPLRASITALMLVGQGSGRISRALLRPCGAPFSVPSIEPKGRSEARE